MLDILKTISIEHKHSTNVLNKLDEHIGDFYKGETPQFEFINDSTDFLKNFLQSKNNIEEQLLFEKLGEKNNKLYSTINELKKTRVKLILLINEFVVTINKIAMDVFIPRSHIKDQANLLISSYKKYLKQQSDILSQLSKDSLLKKDWLEIKNTALDGSNTGITDLQTRYRSSLYDTIMRN